VYIQTTAIQTAHNGNQEYYVQTTQKIPKVLTAAVGSFPDAEVTVFAVHAAGFLDEDSADYEVTTEKLANAGMDSPNEDWSVFILCHSYTSDRIFGEFFIEQLQRLYPKSSIIGGVTGKKMGISTARSFSMLGPGNIVVIGMRGNVPLKTVVSRGMDCISPESQGRIIDVVGGHFLASNFTDLSANKPFNIYQHLQNHEDTVENANEILLGIRTDQTSPFSLRPFRLFGDGVVFQFDEKFVVEDSSADFFFQFFQLSPEACKRDISTSLNLAKLRFSAEGLIPMSGLIFTCGARGPYSNPDFFTGNKHTIFAYLTSSN
jgi:hypothetical protein